MQPIRKSQFAFFSKLTESISVIAQIFPTHNSAINPGRVSGCRYKSSPSTSALFFFMRASTPNVLHNLRAPPTSIPSLSLTFLNWKCKLSLTTSSAVPDARAADVFQRFRRVDCRCSTSRTITTVHGEYEITERVSASSAKLANRKGREMYF